jgi:hypothetical protein
LLAVFGHRARREPNLQLQQQLIGNAFFSPGLDSQPLNDESSSDFDIHAWPPDRSRFPAPEKAECVAMPAIKVAGLTIISKPA